MNNTSVPVGMSSMTDSQFHELVSSVGPDSNGVATCSTTESYKPVSSFLCVPGLSGRPPDPVKEERVLFHTERQETLSHLMWRGLREMHLV